MNISPGVVWSNKNLIYVRNIENDPRPNELDFTRRADIFAEAPEAIFYQLTV